MFFRLRNALQRRQLDRTLREVLTTPAVRLDPQASFALVSLTRERDVFMYLLAVKSFCRWLRPREVHLLTDGEFGPETIRLLNSHVPGIVLEPHTSYRDVRCPAGGCWERLLALSRHAQHGYAIQLDADTVTLRPPTDVSNCISTSTPFTLGSAEAQAIELGAAAAARAKRWLREGDKHVQVLAESVLDHDSIAAGAKYVRGCAGFVGIPQGGASPALVVEKAGEFARLVGPRWSEWGTEQFMSNFLLSNLDNCLVLPHPQYATCGGIDEDRTLVAHMAGFCRFSGGRYGRLARRAFVAMR